MKKFALLFLAFSSFVFAEMKLETIFKMDDKEENITYTMNTQEIEIREYAPVSIKLKIEEDGNQLQYNFTVLHGNKEVGTEVQTRNRGEYAMINCVENESGKKLYQFSARVIE